MFVTTSELGADNFFTYVSDKVIFFVQSSFFKEERVATILIGSYEHKKYFKLKNLVKMLWLTNGGKFRMISANSLNTEQSKVELL